MATKQPRQREPPEAHATTRLAKRICDWCEKLIPKNAQATAKTCSQSCRQAKARFKVGAGAPTPTSGALRFGYADPPYPKTAKKYYRGREVNHATMILKMVREYPDGFAVSTSSKALQYVLGLIPTALAPRVCPWFNGSRPTPSYRERDAWEPVIVCGGRPRRRGPTEGVDNVLVMSRNTRQRLHKGALIGMKPAGFWVWLFELLGATQSDSFEELFRGSGAGERAWRLFTGSRRASTKVRRAA